jgi:arylsulfatase A-like enzyme
VAPVVGVLTLLLACGGPAPVPAGDPSRPDVVLVSIDTLRADHLGSYGYGRPTSPFLDALAARGTRFAAARSASPWTLPAHTTMLTGLLPSTHRVVEDDLRLADDMPLLQEQLRAAGYATAGVVSTLYVSTVYGFQRGFDHFEDFGIHGEKQNLQNEVVAEDVVDHALAWLRTQAPGKPVFLFLHLYDVHYQYAPPPPYDTRFDRAPQEGDARYKNYHFHGKKKGRLDAAQMAHQVAQYDEEIAYVDDQLRRLADATASRPARWIVTSDHGEEFGERGSWGHAHTLYQEQLHVPLIVAGPGIAAGQVVAEPVGTQDLAPTVAAWVGGALPGDGLDLGPSLRGEARPPTDRAMPAETTRFDTNRLSIYRDGKRLEWDLKSGHREYFDHATDPLERQSTLAAHPDDAKALEGALLALLGAPWSAPGGGQVQTEGVMLPRALRGGGAVAPGERFLVLPYDAPLRFSGADGQSIGPFAQVGGAVPGPGAALVLDARPGTGQVELDDAMRKQLEALGYLQAGEEGEGAAP